METDSKPIADVPRRPTSEGDPPALAPLAGYVLESILGQGGMGVVFRARDLTLKRTVALKVMTGNQATHEARARFSAEAEAIARLGHPNFVRIYAVYGRLDQPYYTMELVDGGSLSAWLRGQRLPQDQAAQMTLILARAMHAAHEAGIVHRDLKPANVLLERQSSGEPDEFSCLLLGKRFLPKITDFGLARLLDQNNALTQTGAILGTPSYMAPEQAGGPAKNITPLADVYALGALLFELVTGRPPFLAATALDTVLQVLNEPPPLPRLLAPNLAPDLETICLRCLNKGPHQRYGSASLLADDLARFLRQEPIAGRLVGVFEEFRLLYRRKPVFAWLLIVALALWAVLTLAAAVPEGGASTFAGCTAFAGALIWLSWRGRASFVLGTLVFVSALILGWYRGADAIGLLTGAALGTAASAWLGATWRLFGRRWGQSFLEWLAILLTGGCGAAAAEFFLTLEMRWPSQQWRIAAAALSFFIGTLLSGIPIGLLLRHLNRRHVRLLNDVGRPISQVTAAPAQVAAEPMTIDHVATQQPSAALDDGAIPAINTIAPEMASGPAHAPRMAAYEVLEELGRGGMGVVYLARQCATQRLVALKMIRPGRHQGPMARERFHREARALARLRHPNIVEIFEMGESDGQLYLALEYLDGGCLSNRLNGQPWPIDKAVGLLETLARAVHTAHQQGVVHRDLKPQNVLFSMDGIPKIADFGLASVEEDGPQMTRTGDILGTPHYMSPEQASGNNRDVGPPADIYALGAILYSLLTGAPPLDAPNRLALFEMLLNQPPIPPRRIRPECSSNLEAVCLKCLEKLPTRRYASAAALADDLARLQACEPISLKPPPAWGQVLLGRRDDRFFVNLLSFAFRPATLAVLLMSFGFFLAVEGPVSFLLVSTIVAAMLSFVWWTHHADIPTEEEILKLSKRGPWNESAPVIKPIQDAKAWITVSLSRLRFPDICCACRAPTKEVVPLTIGVGPHEVHIPIPTCPKCHERQLRQLRWGGVTGLFTGGFGGAMLALFNASSHDAMAGMQGAALLLMCGAAFFAGGFFGGVLGCFLAESRPIKWRRFSWEKGTVDLHARSREYGIMLLAANENGK